MKTILVLSPHLDDAVLSCGGMMAAAVEQGISVVVYDLFCAPFIGALSPAARELHANWGSPRDVIASRMDEDRRALEYLGVERMLGDQCDLIYRLDADGNWLYPHMEDIMGERNKVDDALVDHYLDRIKALYPPDEVRINVPLGIGGHVDHLITYDIGVELHNNGFEVAFYEDLPYALKPEWRDTRLGELKGMVSRVEYFSLDHLEKKLKALEFYASQIPELFENVENMRAWLTEWALKMSARGDMGGELVWVFKPQMNADTANTDRH